MKIYQRVFLFGLFFCCLFSVESAMAQSTQGTGRKEETVLLDKETYMRLLKKGDIISVDSLESSYRPVLIVRDTVYVTVPQTGEQLVAKHRSDSADLLKMKAIGRYDRGIKNFRYIPRKKWLGGLTFSYSNFDSADNRLLFSYIQDFSMNLRSFSVKPFVGYAFRDNQILGLKLGYNHTVGSLDNFSFDVDEDLSFTLKDLRYAEDVYSFALFHRSYVGLDSNKRFGFFNELSLGYNNGSSSFQRKEEEQTKRSETRVHELNLGVKPGLSVFIMQNVAAEVSIGVVGFKYRSEKQKDENGVEGSRRSSGANFKINLFNINIGIVACF